MSVVVSIKVCSSFVSFFSFVLALSQVDIMASSAGAFQLNNLSLHKNSSAPSLATGDVLRPVEPKRRASFATPSLLTSKTAEQYPSIEEVPTPIEHQGPVFLLQDLALPSQTSPSLETKDRITNDSVTEEDTHIRQVAPTLLLGYTF